MTSMRALWFLVLAACSFQGPESADNPATGDAPATPDAPMGDAPALGDRARSIDLVDGKVSGGPHVDFPLLFSTTQAYLKDRANGGDVARADGFDIYFSADPDGTARLAHEVEKYDPVTGQLMAWIKLPSLDASTVIYLHYGSDEITTDQQAIAAVWSTGYVAVLHLDDSTESTGTATSVSVEAQEEFDTPLDRGLRFDGLTGRVQIGGSTSIHNIFATGGTAQGWFFATGYGENNFGRIFDKGNGDGWSFSTDNSKDGLLFVHGDSIDFAEWSGPTASVTLNAWHHAAVVYDKRLSANKPSFYIDGVELVPDVARIAVAPMDDDTAALLMSGNRGAGDRTFQGSFDELRMSNVVRSAQWLATEFNNQVDPAAFYTISEPL